jgi:hypothetical protein
VPGSSGILDFADDEAFSERRAVDPSTGLSTFAYAKFLGREFALFIQDNWKVRPHVALTLGLRYEVFLSPKKVGDTFSGILLGPGATRQEQVQNARIGTVDRLFDTDWNNLGPRVGLAWDVGGNGHIVARAGGGIAYNRINLTVWDDRLNPPRFANAFADARDPIPIVYSLGPAFQANPALGRGLDERGGIRGARVDLQVIDPQVTVPYSYSWFAGVQRQLPWQLSFEANYIGTAGRNLMNFDGPNGEDYNRFAGDMADGVRDRLNPSFGAVRLAESRINASYHGLTAQLRRRFSQGVSFQASYTLGHAQRSSRLGRRGHRSRTRLRECGLRHQAQPGAERHLEAFLSRGGRVEGKPALRMAAQRGDSLAVGNAVHRHVRQLRLQPGWRQWGSGAFARLRDEAAALHA